MSDFNTLEQSAHLTSNRTQIAILDFGSQYSHLIARRIRELHVFCELYSCLVSLETLKRNNICGIIFSGGPSSVYDKDSPHVKEEVWKLIGNKNNSKISLHNLSDKKPEAFNYAKDKPDIVKHLLSLHKSWAEDVSPKSND